VPCYSFITVRLSEPEHALAPMRLTVAMERDSGKLGESRLPSPDLHGHNLETVNNIKVKLMTYNYTDTNSTIQCTDPIRDYLGEVIAVTVPDRTAPIRGRLVKLDADYLYIERLSGTRTMIHRKIVLRISTARDVKQVV
jgi:hypothetical protein